MKLCGFINGIEASPLPSPEPASSSAFGCVESHNVTKQIAVGHSEDFCPKVLVGHKLFLDLLKTAGQREPHLAPYSSTLFAYVFFR